MSNRKRCINFLNFLLQVPLVFPVITLIVSVYLVIAPLVQDPAIEYLVVAMSILAGLIFYVPFVHYRKRLKIIGEYISTTTVMRLHFPIFSIRSKYLIFSIDSIYSFHS